MCQKSEIDQQEEENGKENVKVEFTKLNSEKIIKIFNKKQTI